MRDLRVAFGDREVLHGVDLDVRRGERVAIVGQSGSGKSTLIAALLRLLPGAGHITGGAITLGDDDIAHADEPLMRRIRGGRIGLVPQDPSTNLNPSMRVGAQIADALRAGGLRGRSAVRRRVVELMTEAGIPEAARRADQFPHEFSGGMRQRILIAVALARQPELLIADEPTSALDVTVQRQILDHLQTLVDQHGTTLLFVTHDLGVAADRTDRIVVMLDGEVVEQGAPAAILRDPQHEYTKRLIAAAPALSGVAPEPTAPGEPILVVSDLVKEYRLRGRGAGTLRASDGVSFTVRRGTTTAVVGESGSGKTTVARIVLGLESPTSGTALVDGLSIGAARGGSAGPSAVACSRCSRTRTGRSTRRRPSSGSSTSPSACSGSATGRPGPSGWRRSSTRWPCPARSRSSDRTSSPAGSGSASRSPGRWPSSRN